MSYNQLSMFPKPPDPRPPETVTWNLWHGCTNYGEDYIIRIMCFYFNVVLF